MSACRLRYPVRERFRAWNWTSACEVELLAGIRFVVTFEMGQWTRIYVDESLSEAHMEAFDRIMPLAFAGFRRLDGQRRRLCDSGLAAACDRTIDLVDGRVVDDASH